MKFSLTALLLGLALQTFAQPYIKGGNTRHRFAQMYVGADVRTTAIAQGKTWGQTNENGTWLQTEISPATDLRLKIGGTHFWGHADFAIAFTVASLGTSGFKTGVETSAFYYPWRLTNGKVRPFAGVSFIGQSYVYGDAVAYSNIRFPLQAGLGLLHNNHYFMVTLAYASQANHTYYFSPTFAASVLFPKISFGFGYSYTFETTLSAEKNWLSGQTSATTKALAEQKKLNGFTLGVGLSSALILQDSETHAFLNARSSGTLFPEFAAGYYLHKPDVQINASLRFIRFKQDAFGLEQTAGRNAYTLEAYKFLFDYHGFAPFIGPTISYDDLFVTETWGASQTTYSSSGVHAGLVFGWDIRPNRLQTWYLRTNLRWAPNLNVATGNGNFNFGQLEINFIELVVFPGRLF
jgi:hypothetical protein